MNDNILYLVQLRASAIEQSKKDGYTWMAPSHVLNLLDTIEEQRARVAKLEALLQEYVSEGSATWWETKLIALRAELEKAQKENFALAADQCDDGYGDEWGNHCCRRVDKAIKDAEELALVANAARALLGEAKEWLWQAIPAEAALRARIAAFLGDAT